MRALLTAICLSALAATSCSSGNSTVPLHELPASPYYRIAPDPNYGQDHGNGGPGPGPVDDASSVVPTGDLAAIWDVSIAGVPESTGTNNALVIRPDSSGADIATFSESEGGGILVRCTYNSATDTLSKEAIPLNEVGQALHACHDYRLSYYADGRLAIGAARRNPSSVREVKESAPGSNSFSFQTAVDNTFLPATFDQPAFDYKIDAEGDPQVLYRRGDGILGYAFYLFGSYGLTIIGPAIEGGIAMGLQGSDVVCCYRREGASGEELAIRRFEQVLPNDPGNLDLGSDETLANMPGNNAGLGSALAIGPNGSVHLATMGAGPDLLAAFSVDGQTDGTWTVATVHSGHGGDTTNGPRPSLALLSDGTPVIAYHDTTDNKLRLAVSTTPDANGNTGATWTKYAIDNGASGAVAGLFPALGVLQVAGGTDKILVAYGLSVGTSRKLRTVSLDAPPH
jgi:hypothetical protein